MKLFILFLCTLASQVTLGEDIPSGRSESRRVHQFYVTPQYYGENNVFQTVKSQQSYKGYNHAGYETPLCKTPPPCLNPKDLPRNVNRTFLSFPRVLYASMSSCWGYAQLANVHLGKQVKSEVELEGMCPTQFWNGTGYFDGYGSQFRKRCIPNTDGGYVCVNIAGSGTSGTDISIQSILTSYLVKSDQKTFALFYRCVDNRYADYVSLSSRPWMEKAAAHQALGQVLALGFPESEVRFLPCRPPGYNNNQHSSEDDKEEVDDRSVYQTPVVTPFGYGK